MADWGQFGAGVEGVVAWGFAQPWWWVELWDAAGHVDSPVGMVDESMVPPAERNTVSDAGRAVVDPMDHMVNVAPAGWYRTPWKGTSAISNDHCAADRGGYRVAGSSDVERLTLTAQHHGDDPGVAGDAAGDVGVDRAAQGQRRRADSAL